MHPIGITGKTALKARPPDVHKRPARRVHSILCMGRASACGSPLIRVIRRRVKPGYSILQYVPQNEEFGEVRYLQARKQMGRTTYTPFRRSGVAGLENNYFSDMPPASAGLYLA